MQGFNLFQILRLQRHFSKKKPSQIQQDKHNSKHRLCISTPQICHDYLWGKVNTMLNSRKEAQAWALEHLRIASPLQNVFTTLGHQERIKIDNEFSCPKLFRSGLHCLSTVVWYTDFSPIAIYLPLSFQACLCSTGFSISSFVYFPSSYSPSLQGTI